MKKHFNLFHIALISGALALGACNQNSTAPYPEKTTAENNHEEHGEHKAAGEHEAHHDNTGGAPTDEMIKEGQAVMFENLKEGDEVKSPLKIKMAVKGMEVQPAGELKENTGHHHIIVDGDFIPAGQGVPMDEQHIHFGKGQTETELTLAPGTHKLTLQFADGMHRSYGQKMSQTITVIVK